VGSTSLYALKDAGTSPSTRLRTGLRTAGMTKQAFGVLNPNKNKKIPITPTSALGLTLKGFVVKRMDKW